MKGRNYSDANSIPPYDQGLLFDMMGGLKEKGDSAYLFYDVRESSCSDHDVRTPDQLLIVAFYITGICPFCESRLLPRDSDNLRFCSSCRWGVGHKKEVSQLKSTK